MSIENFVSVQDTDGPRLAAQMEQHVRQYEVDIMNLQRAAALEPGADGITTVKLESGASLRARSVVLSTGARWRQMGVPGEDAYRNKRSEERRVGTEGVSMCISRWSPYTYTTKQRKIKESDSTYKIK